MCTHTYACMYMVSTPSYPLLNHSTTLSCSPCQHGVEEHTETPDIDGRIVTLLLQHLRGHKIGSVARGHEQSILCSQLLGKAKVCNVQSLMGAVGFGIENIGWFQVSVDHSLLVQVLDSGGLAEGRVRDDTNSKIHM